jgi:hypothetical protein
MIAGLLHTGHPSVFGWLSPAVNSMYLLSYRAVQTGPKCLKAQVHFDNRATCFRGWPDRSVRVGVLWSSLRDRFFWCISSPMSLGRWDAISMS